MSFLKSIFCLWAGFLLMWCIPHESLAQLKSSTLHIYKPKSFGGIAMSHRVFYNGTELFWMRNGSRAAYKVYEPGYVHLQFDGYVTVLGTNTREHSFDGRLVFDLSLQQDYYLKMEVDIEGNPMLQFIPEEVGKREFNDLSLFKSRYPLISIEQPKPAYPQQQVAVSVPPSQGYGSGAGQEVRPSQIPQQTGPTRAGPVPYQSDLAQQIPEADKVNQHAVAVVIGNRHYTHQDIPNVDFAHNDAEMVKTYLTKALGFRPGNIIYVEDATQADFFTIFGSKGNHKARLYNMVKPGVSDVFIYYSGHGAPDVASKKAYFIPVNSDPTLVQFSGYPVELLYENLSQIPCNKLSVVLDACFSGSSHNGMLIKNASPVYISPKMGILRRENTMILTSSSGEQVSSWYTEKQHGLFTYFFLKGLQGSADQNKDKTVTLGELKSFLLEEVPYLARKLHNRTQVPEVSGDGNAEILKL